MSDRADQLIGAVARACAKQLRKRLQWCMTRASSGLLSPTPPSLCRSPNGEVFELFSSLQSRYKPAWPQPTPCPRLSRVVGVAVLWSDRTPLASASSPFGTRATRNKAVQPAQLILHATAFFHDSRTNKTINLIPELHQLVDGHRFEVGLERHGSHLIRGANQLSNRTQWNSEIKAAYVRRYRKGGPPHFCSIVC